MDYSYLRFQSEAKKYLGEKLNFGNLTLFLGAGISGSIGLPKWYELINSMIDKCIKDGNPDAINIPKLDKNANTDQLQLKASEIKFAVKDNSSFNELIRDCLYIDLDLKNYNKIIQNNLLISLGAMLMGSKRGTVSKVVTLNFDNILEWYIGLHGYVSNIIFNPPKLEGDEDVQIYHPHGYLPHPDLDDNKSDEVLFDLKSFNTRIGNSNLIWNEYLRSFLRTGICLFVGLSFNSFMEKALSAPIAIINDELSKSRPIGFWILCDEKIDPIKEQLFLQSGIIPLELTKDEIPNFLFEICREASKNIQNKSI